jgi:hypothetical protein
LADNPAILTSAAGGADQLYPIGLRVQPAAPAAVRLVYAPVPEPVSAALVRVGTPDTAADYPAVLEPTSSGDTWYEIIHVFPSLIEFGNILTTVTQTLTIYNADRFSSHSLDSFVNNVGNGTSITDLPSLPLTIEIQSGFELTLEVTPDGPPTIDGTIDFVFDLYTVEVTLTGNRIVVYPFEPESPIGETLEDNTDVLTKKDGTEQRIALRKNPRQSLSMTVFREEGPELSRHDILMFEWQSRVFGVPLWVEQTFLTAAAEAGDTVLQVSDTAFADYRVGSLAIVRSSEISFEALTVASFDATTVTLASPLLGDYAAGSLVMPTRTAIVRSPIGGTRYAVNAAERTVEFSVLDNDVGSSFASAADFTLNDPSSPLDGQIVLSGPNIIPQSTLSESFNKATVFFDNGTGKFSQSSTVEYNSRSYPYTFLTRNRQTLYAVRRLLHALRGRQKIFYVPTAFRDLRIAQPVTSGSSGIVIENIGYNRFAQQRGRYIYGRILLTDGRSTMFRLPPPARYPPHRSS